MSIVYSHSLKLSKVFYCSTVSLKHAESFFNRADLLSFVTKFIISFIL